MFTIYAQLFGIAVFLVATLFLRRGIRRTPTEESAQRLSRVSHAFFWGGMVAPEFLAVAWPGLTHLDELVGLSPLPGQWARWLAGGALAVVGYLLTVLSVQSLRHIGSGLMAFKLTRRVVDARLYEWVRNPMSLGWYLLFIGVSLAAGSTYLLLGTLLVYIPVHAFNLKYFEELELIARHGPSYEEYRRRVPFLVPRWREVSPERGDGFS